MGGHLRNSIVVNQLRLAFGIDIPQSTPIRQQQQGFGFHFHFQQQELVFCIFLGRELVTRILGQVKRRPKLTKSYVGRQDRKIVPAYGDRCGVRLQGV